MASKGAACSLRPSPWSMAKTVTVPEAFFAVSFFQPSQPFFPFLFSWLSLPAYAPPYCRVRLRCLRVLSLVRGKAFSTGRFCACILGKTAVAKKQAKAIRTCVPICFLMMKPSFVFLSCLPSSIKNQIGTGLKKFNLNRPYSPCIFHDEKGFFLLII